MPFPYFCNQATLLRAKRKKWSARDQPFPNGPMASEIAEGDERFWWWDLKLAVLNWSIFLIFLATS
jgi:hypothetical protein